MKQENKLYLVILEVEPLEVGYDYNPLPSHLTLVSRFWSAQLPEEIKELCISVFQNTGHIDLRFEGSAIIGPKHTHVYLISKSAQLSILHTELVSKLELAGANFTHPEFIGINWKPHVSKRDNEKFSEKYILRCTRGYLIEITRTSSGDMRHIHSDLPFGS